MIKNIIKQLCCLIRHSKFSLSGFPYGRSPDCESVKATEPLARSLRRLSLREIQDTFLIARISRTSKEEIEFLWERFFLLLLESKSTKIDPKIVKNTTRTIVLEVFKAPKKTRTSSNIDK